MSTSGAMPLNASAGPGPARGAGAAGGGGGGGLGVGSSGRGVIDGHHPSAAGSTDMLADRQLSEPSPFRRRGWPPGAAGGPGQAHRPGGWWRCRCGSRGGAGGCNRSSEPRRRRSVGEAGTIVMVWGNGDKVTVCGGGAFGGGSVVGMVIGLARRRGRCHRSARRRCADHRRHDGAVGVAVRQAVAAHHVIAAGDQVLKPGVWRHAGVDDGDLLAGAPAELPMPPADSACPCTSAAAGNPCPAAPLPRCSRSSASSAPAVRADRPAVLPPDQSSAA